MQSIRLRKPHNKGDGPPVFSHEFIIQNHADIISCVVMVVFIGLIPQVVNPLASSIIFVHYNETVEPKDVESDVVTSRIDTRPAAETYYLHGWMDVLNIVFYALIWIVIHALLQEYIWERTGKRLHLSKVKTSKYFDSGCLVVFYLVSLIWGVNVVAQEGYLWNWPMLWENYPHKLMSLSLKFFMLNQLAFWLHCYPELYFMKTKKEEIYSKLVLYTSSLLLIGGAYLVKLQHLALILLVLHYSVEFFFHAARLLHYHGKDEIATPVFKLWNVLFVFARIATVFISVLTLWFGLGKVHEARLSQPPPPPPPVEEEGVEEGMEEGKVEGRPDIDLTHWGFRLLGLTFILLLQLWIGWTFLNSQMERAGGEPKLHEPPGKKSGKKSKKNDKTTKSTKPKTS